MSVEREDMKFTSTVFSKYRNTVVDLMDAGQKKHNVHGIGQFDVTNVKKIFKMYYEKSKEKLSLTSYILFAIGKCVGEHPYMQACRKGNELIMFEQVDISTIVEKEVSTESGKTKNPTNYIVRGTNLKSFKQINDEIRDAQFSSFKDKKNKDSGRTKKFFKLPKMFRKVLWKKMLNDPFLKKKLMGTVGVSAVGMFGGKVAGWAIPISPMTLTFIVGGIEEKPKLINEKLENREYLCLTIAIDHDIIDGGPAARFCARLYDFIDNAEGLDEYK
jgi:pyruvate/2-oxoglutarate dehydrogenase complex dihydrolipoamide acyltransferase (E2) component